MSVGPIGQEEAMASPILVTGGTGTLGRQVVPREAGCEVRVLSRRGRDDQPQPQP